MTIERDNDSERQARIDRMISEFRAAQARRDARPNDQVVESSPAASATLAGSATSL